MAMYQLTPLKIFALDRVYHDAECFERMERILAGIGRNPRDVARITDNNLSEVVAELETLWPPEVVPAGQVRSFLRPLIFTTMDLSVRRLDLRPLLKRCPAGTSLAMLETIHGHLTTAIDQHPHHLDRKNNCVCWPTYNFGTMRGCPHGCLYCSAGREGKALTVALNIEEYMEKVVKPVIEANPWNRVFRMILDGADLITFEPEYGLHALFAKTLAHYEDRWGLFHTGSSNVDWLADLPHRDRLVGVWSVTCEAVARDIEPGTGRAIDRVEAARKCVAMGIPARFKFKPVIPVRHWREEYARIIEQALKRVRPESMGFCLYIWNSYENLTRTLNPDLLNPECLEAARAAQEQMRDQRCGPFPHETRRDIYRFLIREARRWDRDIPLYLSTETREMWDELQSELGQDPARYICGCSSVAAPGRRLALSPGFRHSTYYPTPV